MKTEIENDWGDLGEIQEVDCADQIDHLNDVGFEMQSVMRNFSRGGSGGNFGKRNAAHVERNCEMRNLQQIWRCRAEN